MKSLRSIALWSIAVVAVAGCRGNLGGLPASPAFNPASTFGESGANEITGGPKAAERVMPLHTKIGSSNTIYADMPIRRPDTTPCVVKLFDRYEFKDFSNRKFDYAPPPASQCPPPWSKVVFNFDVRVTKGVQYDRTAILWVDGAVVYFGTTSEPSTTLAPHWHVARDVTDLSALFTQPSKGQVQLWNCYCPPSYNGYQIGKASIEFYPPDKQYPAPRVPDQVIGLPYSPPLGNVATLPQTPMNFQGSLPTNIVKAYADVFLQSQNKEEQWFMDVPDIVWRQSHHALGFSRGTAFREGVVTVNGQPAGLAPIYPWIYTGGMDPYLWYPIPGVQTLNFVPFRVDLTPFAGELSNGSTQSIDVSVFHAYSYFSGAGDLLLYLDPKQSQVTGKVTQDTLGAKPDETVVNTVTYGTGTGLFGGKPAQGDINTHSHTNYTIAGYVNGSAGKVTTSINADALFANEQSFDYASSRYTQLLRQNTHFDSQTTTTGAKTTTAQSSLEYPLTVSYPILASSSGFKLPVKVYQGYRAQTTDSDGRTVATDTSNTVKTKNTLLFNSSFQVDGEKNSSSIQLYTYKSNRPAVCYGKQIESKANVVTAITRPGCSAQPPPRHRPRV